MPVPSGIGGGWIMPEASKDLANAGTQQATCNCSSEMYPTNGGAWPPSLPSLG